MDGSVKVKGVKDTISVLQAAKKATLVSTSTFSTIGRDLTRFFSGEVFASRGGVIGEPWQALDDAYAAWKAKKYPGSPPLVRTGKMSNSFRYQAGPGFVRLYNPTKYFKYHQTGQGVPQRVMMKIDATRKDQIAQTIAERLRTEIRRAS